MRIREANKERRTRRRANECKMEYLCVCVRENEGWKKEKRAYGMGETGTKEKEYAQQNGRGWGEKGKMDKEQRTIREGKITVRVKK